MTTPIPDPQMGMMDPSAAGGDPGNAMDSPDANQQMMMQIGGATAGGAVPMQPAPGIEKQYPGLRAQAHVDWHKVNPRLLQVLDKEAQATGNVIVLHKGYMDHMNNHAQEGHPTSSHKRGLSVDAFINGHPLGEVIDPAKLGKAGIEVGGPNGDMSHVELMGIPVKGGK